MYLDMLLRCVLKQLYRQSTLAPCEIFRVVRQHSVQQNITNPRSRQNGIHVLYTVPSINTLHIDPWYWWPKARFALGQNDFVFPSPISFPHYLPSAPVST